MGKKYVQGTVQGLAVKIYLNDIRKIHRWQKKVKTVIPAFDSKPIMHKESQNTHMEETCSEEDQEDSFLI